MLGQIRNVLNKEKIGHFVSDFFTAIIDNDKEGKKKLVDFERLLRFIVLKLVEQGFDWKHYLSTMKNHDKVLILGNSQDKAWVKNIYAQLKQDSNKQLQLYKTARLSKKLSTRGIYFDWVVVGVNLCTFCSISENNFLLLKQLKTRKFLLRCKLENNDFYAELHPQPHSGLSVEKWKEWLSARGELINTVNCPYLQELHCQFCWKDENSGARE